MENIIKNVKRKIESNLVIVCNIVCALVIFILGYLYNNFNIGLLGIMYFFIYAIISMSFNFKRNFLILVFYATIFTFILSRPVISFFRGNDWWYFEPKCVWIVLICILLSMIFIFIGNLNTKKNLFSHNYSLKYKKLFFDLDIKNVVTKMLFIFLMISFISNGFVEIYQYISLKNIDYAKIYTDNNIDIPLVFSIISGMLNYILCAYLALFPSKRQTYLCLLLYVILAIPSLLLGARNIIVIRILFSIIYIFIRSVLKKEKWITKYHISIAAIVVPILIILLSFMNYSRESNQENNVKKDLLYMFVDFFYKQGTTFDTICQGITYTKELRNEEFVINYTFGGMIDNVKYGFLAKNIFNAQDLGTGNSEIMALKSNSMAHHLSYRVLGDQYLLGHGRGSSYIIELYMDFGLLGVIIFSYVLGVFFRSVNNILKKCYLNRYIVLIILTSIFIIPRAEATLPLQFITNTYFYIFVFILLITIGILQLRKNNK